MNQDLHQQDPALASEWPGLLGRRRVLALVAGAGLAVVAGCAAKGNTATTSATASDTTNATAGTATTTAATPTTAAAPATSATAATPATTASATADAAATSAAGTASAASTTEAIPTETAGPFPGDGSNGPNVLNQSGVVRRDIASSFGSASGTAVGVPTTIALTVTDVANGGAPYAGAAVYLWHCDRDGNYSMYSQGVTDQNYLRGVQEADASGRITFDTIFPAAYSGRWPHIHFEVFPTLAAAGNVSNKIATSQLAIPEATCDLVYATAGYERSVTNMDRTSLTSDNVFRDGVDQQLATVTGDVATGLTLSLVVPV